MSIHRRAILAALLCCATTAAAERGQRIWADELTNTLGGPSRDGRYLSFVDARSGDLAIRNLETGEIRRLTRNDASSRGQFAYFSTISADAGKVAYAWFNEEKFYDLRVADLEAGSTKVLYRNEEAGFVQPCAWSADGKQILTLFFRKDNISQIALVPVDGGAVRVLKSLNWVYPKRMDFSPDGRYIVYDSFAHDGAQQRDIFVLAVDGSRETRLIQHEADDLFPLWSHDGSSIYFASDRSGTMDLWTIPVDAGKPAGNPLLVRANLGRFLPMALTSAGTLFYGLREGRTDIHITGPNRKEPMRLRTRFPGRNSTPEWSPDGRSVAFLSRRGTENYGQDSRVITVHTIASGEERDLEPALAHIERMRWSGEGKGLLVSGSDNKGRAGVFLLDIESAALTALVTEAGGSFRGFPADWSADGASVMYAREGHILERTLRPSEDRKVVDAGCEIAHVAAGRRAAFVCGNAVYVVAKYGSTPMRVATVSGSQPITSVRWSASGDLWFAAGSAMFRLSAQSDKPERLSAFDVGHGDIALHPDGKRIAFTSGQTRSEVWALPLPLQE